MLPKEIAEKINWLFLVLPGFLSLTITSLIVDLGAVGEFQLVLYSFALTLVNAMVVLTIYRLGSAVRGWIEKTKFCFKDRLKTPRLSDPNNMIRFYGMTLFVSVITGLTVGICAEKDWFYTFARSFRVIGLVNRETAKRPLAYLLYSNDAGAFKTLDGRFYENEKSTDAWMRVEVGNHTYEGWPRYYSLGSALEIYLSPACRIETNNGSEELRPVYGPGVVLYEKEIKAIYFLDRTSLCRTYWVTNPLNREGIFPRLSFIGK